MLLTNRLLCLILLLPFCSIAQTFTSSNLPIVILNTNGQTIVDNVKINAFMGIIWNGPGKRNYLSDPKNNFNGNIAIEKRGSSSQQFPKKSYGFETKAIDWMDLNVSLIDLPAENDWVLYAPYTDKTMIRDVLTYTLDASLGHYAPRCRYVELVLNGKYDGVYVLMEKIKRDKNRVDIAKLLSTDNSGENLTGGYIIKIDKTTGGSGVGWYSDYPNALGKTFYQYDYPKSDVITGAQYYYIQTYVRDMEKALYYEKFSGTGNYHEYLNDSSFIDFMIINEMAKNVDGYRLSSYLFKDKNKLMNCGPIWDFNLTYGNANYVNGWMPTGFQLQADLGSDNYQNPFWWKKLMADPSFVSKLKRRWTLIRKKQFSNSRINAVTDSLVDLLSEAQGRNYQRWPILGTYVWPNYNWYGNNYAAEVSWMKNWLSQRLIYMDSMLPYDFTGTEKQLLSASSSVFPNPFKEELTIHLDASVNGNTNFELFNASGFLVYKTNLEIQNGQAIVGFSEIKNLATGMYLLRVSQKNGILLTEKVLKQ